MGKTESRMIIHQERSPLAGKTVRIRTDAEHHLYSDFAGSYAQVVDWWDRYTGKPMSHCHYGVLVVVYQTRCSRYLMRAIPRGQENDVLLVRIKGGYHAVHLIEIQTDNPELPEAA
jgi:hypothetical protein